MVGWVPWQDAAEMTALTGATWTATSRLGRHWSDAVRRWATELTLLLVLYAAWQYAGSYSIGRVGAATGRGRWLWDAERTLHLPNEGSLQTLVTGHRALVEVLDAFYAGAHVGAMAACLVWLFVRHRELYPVVRTTVVLLTGACLAIQMLPVAPPRLVPGLGVVDTGRTVGPSVYSPGAPGIDQLSAMPSLHVGWALAVAGAVVLASHRRRRWLALAYPVATTLVVVLTGNHYWADAFAAAAIYPPALWGATAIYRHRAGRSSSSPGPP